MYKVAHTGFDMGNASTVVIGYCDKLLIDPKILTQKYSFKMFRMREKIPVLTLLPFPNNVSISDCHCILFEVYLSVFIRICK